MNFIVILSTEGRVFENDDLGKISKGEKYGCILVLGAGVKADGTPSDMLTDRLLTAIELYKLGVSDTVLMTGDSQNADDYDEVGTMKRFAIENGVSEDAIICDPYGLSTFDSITRAKYVFGYDNMVIVTQTYHLYRALYIADSEDITSVGASANIRKYRGQNKYDIREMAARCKDILYTIVK